MKRGFYNSILFIFDSQHRIASTPYVKCIPIIFSARALVNFEYLMETVLPFLRGLFLISLIKIAFHLDWRTANLSDTVLTGFSLIQVLTGLRISIIDENS